MKSGKDEAHLNLKTFPEDLFFTGTQTLEVSWLNISRSNPKIIN